MASTSTFPKVKELSNFTKDSSTSVMTQTGSLPGIDSLLDVLRCSNGSPRQLTSEQTTSGTWKQFRIRDDRNYSGQPLSATFCPLYHDDPVFTLDLIPHSTQQFGEGRFRRQTRPNQNTRRSSGEDQETHDISKYKGILWQERKYNDVNAENIGSEVKKELNACVVSSMQTQTAFKQKLTENDAERPEVHVENNLRNSPVCIPSCRRDPKFFDTIQSVQIGQSRTDKSCCATKPSKLNTSVMLKNRETEEGSIRDLFTSLEQFISSEADKTKDQSLTRDGILESSARFIQSLLKKSPKMKPELGCRTKKLKSRESTRTAKSVSSKTACESSKAVHLPPQNTNQVNQRSGKNYDIPTVGPKIVFESEKESGLLSNTHCKQNVAITFVSENHSSQVSDTNKKSIAIFFADKSEKFPNYSQNAKQTSQRQKVTYKRSIGLNKREKNKREIERLEKKAFQIFAKYWRPRLKKEMPVCSRIEMTNLLKGRWEGLSKKSKRRYRKIWEEQSKVKHSALKVKPKTFGSQGSPTRSKIKKTRDSRKPISGKPRKEQDTMKNASDGKGGQPLKKRSNKRINEEKNLLSVVNWAQCDQCKKWRILPENKDVNTLPKRWFCRMNKDKKHNRCSIPQESQAMKA